MDGQAAPTSTPQDGPREMTNGVEGHTHPHNDQNHADTIHGSQEYDLWRINYEKLVKLLVTVGPQAMCHIFNNIHSPINLVSNLAQAATMTTLRRLRSQGLISEQQWGLLYSQRKSQVNSSQFDANLLFLLLKNICPLTPPYPDGWRGLPLQTDLSLSADIVRIQWFRTLLVNRRKENEGRVEEKEYRAYWEQIKEVLIRLGGLGVKVKVDRLEREKSPKHHNDDEDYVQQLLDWDSVARDIAAREAELHKSHGPDGSDLSQMIGDSYSESNRGSPSRQADKPRAETAKTGKDVESRKPIKAKKTTVHTKDVTVLSQEEIQAHERTVLLKFYKQLTETVQSDDVIPKLIQRGLLSHEEKNRITLSTRNSDRMKFIIELVSKKGGNAFDKFCDSIKYKYKKLSDQLVKAKTSPFKVDKPDEQSQCSSTIRAVYRTILKTVTPIPWYSEIQVPLADFILPLYITDYNGRNLKVEEIFEPHPKCEKPKRILLEGFEGVGKSTLLRSLAQQWVHGDKNHFLHRFKMVFLIDMKKVTDDLAETVSKQCLELGGYVRTENEISSLLEESQDDVLYLLDGYEDNNKLECNIWELVQRTLYPRSTVLMTSNSQYVTPSLVKNFDTSLILLGLEPDTQEDLVDMYARVTHNPADNYSGLVNKLVSEYNTSIRDYTLNPLYGMCLCLVSEMGGNMDFHTRTFMMNTIITSIQKLYCSNNNENMEEGAPDHVKQAMTILEKLAFDWIQNNKILFSYQDLLDYAGPQNTSYAEMAVNLGLLVEVYGDDEEPENRVYTFVNRVFQEYLAARHLSRIDPEDFGSYVEDLVGEKHLNRVAMYFCGIHRYDFDLQTMNDMFNALAESNRRLCISSRRSTREVVNVNIDEAIPRSEGRLSALSLCLECLAEGEGRKDVLDLVSDSFPWRIYMKQKIHHSPLALQGLAQIITANIQGIIELEIRLDHIGMYYENFILMVADAVEKNTNLMTLRLRWTLADALALFLANVFGSNRSLRNLHVMDDSQSDDDQASATVCSNLWSAGNSMQSLNTIAFMYCRNPAIVTSIIRNLPEQLSTLYLNNCKLNQNGAQELMNKIEKSQCLRRISLASVRLKCSDFLPISYGLKRNKSLTELILSDVHMEENAIEGLSEALKFNSSLKRLDLKRVSLNVDGCRKLGNALNINPVLMEVNLVDAKVHEDGARILFKLKRDGILLNGLDQKKIVGKHNYNPLDHSESI